jgi:DNA-binding GntR family transcriptional regulator
MTRGTKAARPSLVDIATEKIRDRILDLTLAPGSQIDETFLRDKLGISRTPAREALSRLVTEGLVDNARGFFVRPLDLRETAQFFDAYMIVERGSAMLCKFSNPSFVEDLHAIQRKHSHAVATDAFLDITRHNADFHLRIAQATENSFLFEHAIRIHNLARRLAFFVYANESENEDLFKSQQDSVVNEHDEMIACIERADRRGLVAITTGHSERLRARIADYVTGSRRETFENIVEDRTTARSAKAGKAGATVVAIDGGKP